ncbi:hypothetical protein [Enterobacter cloacae]|uniref:hypothetical protein n=1 Tax=Enterobacter cloacae TaxID=550 RepID=UPI003360E241
MNLLSLAHRRALRYPDSDIVWSPASISVRSPDDTTVLTFARTGIAPKKLDARQRLFLLPPGDVVLSCFDDSPLYALLVWDIALAMKPGARIYLQHSDNVARLMAGSWYQQAFSALPDEVACTVNDAPVHLFEKVAPLPAERERGLDAWSFCIPTGAGDPSALNACVARILALNLPRHEILLCGRPREDFLFWEHVRIVGEDISAPPIHITRKKNRLVEEARYPNLCILHDRVLLPVNFREAVVAFGDDFPFVAFPSYWFADTWQAVPRRYSDGGVAERLPDSLITEQRPGREILAEFSHLSLSARHPARAAHGRDYLTGSLYLCKKSVWQHIPQNEALYWQEYEDLEQAFRAAIAGIPSRLNPYSLTQSLSYRSLMHFFGRLQGENIAGHRVTERVPTELWGFPRRPHLPFSRQEAWARLARFARCYIGDDVLLRQAPTGFTGVRRFTLIARLLWRAKGDTRPMLDDWCREILCEAQPEQVMERLRSVMESHTPIARRKMALLLDPSLLCQIWNNPFSPPFTGDAHLPVLHSSWRRFIGSFFSALWLTYGSRHADFSLSLCALWRLIRQGAQEGL